MASQTNQFWWNAKLDHNFVPGFAIDIVIWLYEVVKYVVRVNLDLPILLGSIFCHGKELIYFWSSTSEATLEVLDDFFCVEFLSVLQGFSEYFVGQTKQWDLRFIQE